MSPICVTCFESMTNLGSYYFIRKEYSSCRMNVICNSFRKKRKRNNDVIMFV